MSKLVPSMQFTLSQSLAYAQSANIEPNSGTFRPDKVPIRPRMLALCGRQCSFVRSLVRSFRVCRRLALQFRAHNFPHRNSLRLASVRVRAASNYNLFVNTPINKQTSPVHIATKIRRRWAITIMHNNNNNYTKKNTHISLTEAFGYTNTHNRSLISSPNEFAARTFSM